MAFYPWERILDAGLLINDMGTQIAEASREFGCRLWRSYPDSWTRSTPNGSPARQFWNSVCNPPHPPVLPSTPAFTGGQCDFKYNIEVEFAAFASSTSCNVSVDPSQNVQATVWGPVTFFGLDQPAGSCGGFTRLFCVCHGSGAFARNPNRGEFPLSFLSGGRFESIRSISISPESGQPDNCGNAPSSYPPDTPPQPGDETYNVTFTTDVTNNFNFNLVWNDVDFSIPLTFEFDVGDINLDFDGVNINFNQNNNWNLNPPPRVIPPAQPPALPPDATNYEENILPLDDSGEEDIGIEIEYITLELTVIPANPKTQFGNNGPDVYYAGWFEFRTNNFYYPRQPIHWRRSIFIPPKGATGYAYTLYVGFKGIISTYKLNS